MLKTLFYKKLQKNDIFLRKHLHILRIFSTFARFL